MNDRAGEQAFVAESSADGRRMQFGWVDEAVLAEWDALFNKLRSYRPASGF